MCGAGNKLKDRQFGRTGLHMAKLYVKIDVAAMFNVGKIKAYIKSVLFGKINMKFSFKLT